MENRESNEILGQEVRALRMSLSMTGQELARVFNISQQHLSRIERGEVQEVQWTISFLIKVCTFFDIPMIHFIKLLEKETSVFHLGEEVHEVISDIYNNKNRRCG